AEELPDKQTRLMAPRALVTTAENYCDVYVRKIPVTQDEEIRPLHAKILILENDEWELRLIGSSNFTRAGLGLRTGAANLEANLAYLTRVGTPEFRRLQQVWPAADDDIDINDK